MSARPAHPLADWKGWQSIPGDAVPVVWSNHALERWALRLGAWREMTPEQAAVEMCRMLAAAHIVREPPAWVTGDQANHDVAAAWLIIGDAALPLANRNGELHAMTVLIAGDIVPQHRANVNSTSRQRRAARRMFRETKHGRESKRLRTTLLRDADRKAWDGLCAPRDAAP
jgi:hypothetical protein